MVAHSRNVLLRKERMAHSALHDSLRVCLTCGYHDRTMRMIMSRMLMDRNGCRIVARSFAVLASMSAVSPKTCKASLLQPARCICCAGRGAASHKEFLIRLT